MENGWFRRNSLVRLHLIPTIWPDRFVCQLTQLRNVVAPALGWNGLGLFTLVFDRYHIRLWILRQLVFDDWNDGASSCIQRLFVEKLLFLQPNQLFIWHIKVLVETVTVSHLWYTDSLIFKRIDTGLGKNDGCVCIVVCLQGRHRVDLLLHNLHHLCGWRHLFGRVDGRHNRWFVRELTTLDLMQNGRLSLNPTVVLSQLRLLATFLVNSHGLSF